MNDDLREFANDMARLNNLLFAVAVIMFVGLGILLASIQFHWSI